MSKRDLSEKENRVLDLWAANLKGPEIAAKLCVTSNVITSIVTRGRDRGDPRAKKRLHRVTRNYEWVPTKAPVRNVVRASDFEDPMIRPASRLALGDPPPARSALAFYGGWQPYERRVPPAHY